MHISPYQYWLFAFLLAVCLLGSSYPEPTEIVRDAASEGSRAVAGAQS